jgi:hypothetical protein
MDEDAGVIKEPRIGAHLDDIERSLAQQRETLSVMKDRLGSVMADDRPRPDGDEQGDDTFDGSPMAYRLVGIEHTIERNTAIIHDMLQRMEI